MDAIPARRNWVAVVANEVLTVSSLSLSLSRRVEAFGIGVTRSYTLSIDSHDSDEVEAKMLVSDLSRTLKI